MNARPTIDPRYLCQQHLNGAHFEHHKHEKKWTVKKMRPGKYLTNNCFEPANYKARHDEFVAEMLRRGGNHNSPIEQPDFSYLPDEEREWKADPEAARQALMDRCWEYRTMILHRVDFLSMMEAGGQAQKEAWKESRKGKRSME